MKTARWAFLIVLLGVVMAGLIVWHFKPTEPSYQDRSLSSWLREWSASYYDRSNSAAVAIREIGSNGIPILLAQMTQKQSPNQRKLWRFIGKFAPDALNPIYRISARSVAAAEAINLLGPEAKTAFPTLTNLMFVHAHCITASIALAGIGSDGVTVLLQALTNQDWVFRHASANALGQARSDYDRIVPALLETAQNGGRNQQDQLVRGAAAYSLVQLHTNSNVIVPVFCQFPTNSDAGTRMWGASLLGEFGADAKAAIPLLAKSLSDTNADVRKAAEQSLKEINQKEAVSPPQ
ncbi:MAG TPA: HEAT repeat domain-containing protein [Verrucomicrobiae bacterium]|jgi:HEAT repeat protein